MMRYVWMLARGLGVFLALILGLAIWLFAQEQDLLRADSGISPGSAEIITAPTRYRADQELKVILTIADRNPELASKIYQLKEDIFAPIERQRNVVYTHVAIETYRYWLRLRKLCGRYQEPCTESLAMAAHLALTTQHMLKKERPIVGYGIYQAFVVLGGSLHFYERAEAHGFGLI